MDELLDDLATRSEQEPRSLLECFDEKGQVDLGKYYLYRRARRKKLQDEMDELLDELATRSEQEIFDEELSPTRRRPCPSAVDVAKNDYTQRSSSLIAFVLSQHQQILDAQ
jgi:hypothetical protein